MYLVSGGGVRAFALTYLAYFTVYILRKPISVAKPLLQQEFAWGTTELGLLDTAFLLLYAMTQFYFGYLGDVFRPRLVLVLSIAGSAVTLWCCQWLSTIVPIILFCALQGAFQGVVWPTVVKAVDPWILMEHRSTTMIWWASHQALGGILGTLLAVYLADHSGWRSVFTAPALLGLAVAAILLVFMPDAKVSTKVPPRDEIFAAAGDDVSLSYRELFQLPGVWNASSSFFVVKCTKYVLLMWLPMLFVQLLGYDLTTAGIFSALYDVGNAVASPACGILGGLFGGDVAKMCFWLEVCLVGVLAVFPIIGSSSSSMAGLCALLCGVCCGGADLLLSGPIAANIGASASVQYNRPVQGTVVGVICGMGSIGAVLQGFIVAALTEVLGWTGCLLVLAGLSGVAAFLVYPLVGRDGESPAPQNA